MNSYPTQDQDQDLHLVDYIRPLLSRKWLVLAIVVLVTAGTYFYYERQPEEFTASTRIIINSEGGGGALVGIGALPTTDRTTENQATLLESRQVAARVVRRLELPVSPESVLGSVTATATTGSDFLVITTRRPTAKQAADFANAFADAFIELRGEQLRDELTRTLEESQSQLNDLPSRRSNALERAELAATVRRLKLARSLPPGRAQQLDRALPPANATAPRPVRNALFALALALIAGVALAFGLEKFDRRVQRVDDVEAAYGLSVLAVLPHSGDPALVVDGRVAVSPDFREAFRQLRTNLQLQGLHAPLRRILVTSAIPGEGKSTVTRNLAIAFGEFGQKVAVVDADFRRPQMSKLFAVEAGAGFTSVLTGEHILADALLEIPIEARGLDTLAQMEAASVASPAKGEGGPAEPPAEGPSLGSPTAAEFSFGPGQQGPRRSKNFRSFFQGGRRHDGDARGQAAVGERDRSEVPDARGQAAVGERDRSEVPDARGQAAVGERDPSEVPDASTLHLLPSGPLPGDPPGVLAAGRTHTVLDALAESHDVLLIDSPPIIPVSDALALAGHVDAVIIVCRLGLSTRDGAQRARELLSRVPDAHPVGVVANDLTGLQGGGYAYGYGYGADER